MGHPYGKVFYDAMAPHVASSAWRVLEIYQRSAQPSSLVDVGCGTGHWLAAASQLGIDDIVGLDGDWVDPEDLHMSPEVFVRADLASPLPDLQRRFDVCLCLEVAEHLPEIRAKSFVNELCALSDAVIFSAAIPGQGGTHHVNERPQTYWIDLFSDNGFGAHDLFRPEIWNDGSIAVWYRQNMFLFQRGAGEAIAFPDAVHPDLLDHVVRRNEERIHKARSQQPSVSRLLKELPGALRRSFQRRTGRPL